MTALTRLHSQSSEAGWRSFWLTSSRPKRQSGWEMADAPSTLQHIERCVCPPCGWALILRAAPSSTTCPCSDVSWLTSGFWHLRWHQLNSFRLSMGVTQGSGWHSWPAQAQQRCDMNVNDVNQRCEPGVCQVPRAAGTWGVQPAFVKQL